MGERQHSMSISESSTQLSLEQEMKFVVYQARSFVVYKTKRKALAGQTRR